MTLLITKNKDVYILDHLVDNYVTNEDLNILLKEVNNNTTLTLSHSILVSSMGVPTSEDDLNYRVPYLKMGSLSIDHFAIPDRKEWGYHAKI